MGSSIHLWQAAVLTKMSAGWLFAAVVILFTEIALHLSSNFAALYAVETVLNVLDVVYFAGVLVVVAITLWSLNSSNSIALEPSLSQSQKGTVAVGASAPLSLSQHQAQLPPSTKPPPEPFPKQVKMSKDTAPSAPPLPQDDEQEYQGQSQPQQGGP